MIGYADNGYRLWNESERKVTDASNVIFEEKEQKIQTNIFIANNKCEDVIIENVEIMKKH